MSKIPKPNSPLDSLGMEVDVRHEEGIKDPHPHRILKILGKDCAPENWDLLGYFTTFIYASDIEGKLVFKHISDLTKVNKEIVPMAVADGAKALKSKIDGSKHEWRQAANVQKTKK